MLSYSNPPSNPLWMDLSSDIGSLPFGGIYIEPMPGFENSIFTRSISSVGAMN
jgi:hypothetical protein